MIKTLLLYLIFFFLPLAIYLYWVYFRAEYLQRDNESSSEGDNVSKRSGWPWAIALGGLLVMIALFYSAFLGGSSPDSEYMPPSYKDGKIIPGKTIKRD